MTALWIVLALLAVAAAVGGFCLWWFWLRLLPVDWRKCTLASLWDGSDAQRRMMNMLSPSMSDGKFRDYLKWQKKDRGANTVHLILANQGDGENAVYSIYGPGIDWTVDKGVAEKMLERIKECRKAGMGVVMWLITDDSSAMNKLILSDPARYVGDLKKLGLFKFASIVCLGLELSDSARTVAPIAALEEALRKVYKGKVATHDVSMSLRFAGLGDIVFAQVQPETSDAAMLAFATKVKATGKPCGIIEHRRNPDRARCELLIKAGLPFVGNW